MGRLLHFIAHNFRHMDVIHKLHIGGILGRIGNHMTSGDLFAGFRNNPAHRSIFNAYFLRPAAVADSPAILNHFIGKCIGQGLGTAF